VKVFELLFENLLTGYYNLTQYIPIGNFWPFDSSRDTWREVLPRDDAKSKRSRCCPTTYAPRLSPFKRVDVDLRLLCTGAKWDAAFVSDDRDRLSVARQRSDNYNRETQITLSLKKGVIDGSAVSVQPMHDSARRFILSIKRLTETETFAHSHRSLRLFCSLHLRPY